jgi:glycosyltransferase involved in cell wall biosynthesis
MKTLIISNLYPPNALGGYERLCYSVADALVARHHQVTVLTSTYGGKTADFLGQTIFRTLILLATEGNIYQTYNVTEARRAEINGYNINTLDQIVFEIKPDVIFIWNLYFFDSSLIHNIEDKYSDKVVYFLTDNWLISFYNKDYLGQYFPRVVFGSEKDDDVISQKRPIQLGGSAIFGSSFMEKFYSNAGIQFHRSKIIHNGVQLPSILKNIRRNRFFPVSYGTLRLLFAGRVVDVKGVDCAIRALPLIADRLPNISVSLDIVGDRQDKVYYSKMSELVKEIGVEKMVSFKDTVPQNELFGLFQEYDIYLFPSIYEPFSLTLIFALHAGIPTVASNVGGNPEIIIDNKTGLLFNKHSPTSLMNAIFNLYNLPLHRFEISRNAQSESFKYTFSKMVQLVDLFLRK